MIEEKDNRIPRTPSLVGASLRSVATHEDNPNVSSPLREPSISRDALRLQSLTHTPIDLNEDHKDYITVKELRGEGALLHEEQEYDNLYDEAGNLRGDVVAKKKTQQKQETITKMEDSAKTLAPKTVSEILVPINKEKDTQSTDVDEVASQFVKVDHQPLFTPQGEDDSSSSATPAITTQDPRPTQSRTSSIYDLDKAKTDNPVQQSLEDLIDSQMASMTELSDGLKKSISTKRQGRVGSPSRSRSRSLAKFHHQRSSADSSAQIPDLVLQNDAAQTFPAGAPEGSESPLLLSRSQSVATTQDKQHEEDDKEDDFDVQKRVFDRPNLARGDSYAGVPEYRERPSNHSLLDGSEHRSGRTAYRTSTATEAEVEDDPIKRMRSGSRDYLRSISISRSRSRVPVIPKENIVTEADLVKEGALINDPEHEMDLEGAQNRIIERGESLSGIKEDEEDLISKLEQEIGLFEVKKSTTMKKNKNKTGRKGIVNSAAASTTVVEESDKQEFKANIKKNDQGNKVMKTTEEIKQAAKEAKPDVAGPPVSSNNAAGKTGTSSDSRETEDKEAKTNVDDDQQLIPEIEEPKTAESATKATFSSSHEETPSATETTDTTTESQTLDSVVEPTVEEPLAEEQSKEDEIDLNKVEETEESANGETEEPTVEEPIAEEVETEEPEVAVEQDKEEDDAEEDSAKLSGTTEESDADKEEVKDEFTVEEPIAEEVSAESVTETQIKDQQEENASIAEETDESSIHENDDVPEIEEVEEPTVEEEDGLVEEVDEGDVDEAETEVEHETTAESNEKNNETKEPIQVTEVDGTDSNSTVNTSSSIESPSKVVKASDGTIHDEAERLIRELEADLGGVKDHHASHSGSATTSPLKFGLGKKKDVEVEENPKEGKGVKTEEKTKEEVKGTEPAQVSAPTPVPAPVEKEVEEEKEEDFHEPTREEIIELLKDEPVYIYTSLAGGGFHMPQRTNRLVTILTANQIPFKYRDLGTDEEARGVWRRFSKGRLLPGVVRGKDDIIGNWEEIEEFNEEYRLRELIYETL